MEERRGRLLSGAESMLKTHICTSMCAYERQATGSETVRQRRRPPLHKTWTDETGKRGTSAAVVSWGGGRALDWTSLRALEGDPGAWASYWPPRWAYGRVSV